MTTETTSWRRALGIAVAAALAICVIVLAFMWPAKTAEPKNLPISIAGPEAAVQAMTPNLGGVVDPVTASSREEAVDQIRRHESYGGIVLPSEPGKAPEILTSPAAGPAPTQLLQGMATKLQAQLQAGAQDQIAALTEKVAAAEQAGDAQALAQAKEALAQTQAAASSLTVTVTPVVPLASTDATGSGLASAGFPLALGGMIGGALVALSVRGTWRKLGSVAAYAALAGVAMTLVMQTWFQYLQGDFWLNALAIGLAAAATGTFVVGLDALLGRGGLGLAAAVTVLLGNPLSGAAMPWQFLAEPWGAIGQYLVPGASNTLIRLLSYFPDADTTTLWATLIAWTVGGATLIVVGGLMRRHAPKPVVAEDEAPAELPTPEHAEAMA